MRTVFLVDDMETELETLADRLRFREWGVVTASSVDHAKEIIGNNEIKIDVAVLDMVMCDDTKAGLKILESMHLERPRIDNVILTAFPSPETDIASAHLGILAYLEKTVDFEVLCRFLEMGYRNRYGEAFRLERTRKAMWALGMPPGKEELLYLEDVPLPRFKDDEIVAMTRYLGVCGTDVESLSSSGSSDRRYPLIAFHEAVGEVVAVGRGIHGKFNIGDWVIPLVRRCHEWEGEQGTEWNFDILPCKKSHECDTYLQPHSCPGYDGRTHAYLSRGTGKYHGFGSEYFSDSEEYLVRVSYEERTTLEHLCVLAEPASIGLKAVRLVNELRGIRSRDRVLVVGLGPIGMFCIALLCYRFHIHNVCAMDTVPRGNHKASVIRMHCEKEYGTIYQQVQPGKPWPDEVIAKGFDIIIDASSATGDVFSQACSAIRPQGILALLGFDENANPMLKATVNNAFFDALVRGGIRIIGSASASKQDVKDSLAFMAKQCPKAFLEDLIHPNTTILPKDAPERIRKLKDPKDHVKIMIQTEHPNKAEIPKH